MPTSTFDSDTKKLALGVKLFADTVKPTLGPAGRAVRINMPDGTARDTRLGSLIAGSVTADDPWKARGIDMMKDAAARANDFGGGTAVTAVLTQAILAGSRKAIAAGADPVWLQQGIDDAVAAALLDINKQSQSVSAPDQLVHVGTISAGGDVDVGMITARAFVDKPHIITIQNRQGSRWTIDYDSDVYIHGNDRLYGQMPQKGHPAYVTLDRQPGGLAVIKVDGTTDADAMEREWRVKAAVQASVAALRDGVVAGGGAALLHASKSLDALPGRNDAYRMGVDIVRKALGAPLRQLTNNAGVNGTKIVDSLLQRDDTYFGYDVATRRYANMHDAGIIDPAKVVTQALHGAGSIASATVMAPAIARSGSGFAEGRVKNPYIRYFVSDYDAVLGYAGYGSPSALSGGDVGGIRSGQGSPAAASSIRDSDTAADGLASTPPASGSGDGGTVAGGPGSTPPSSGSGDGGTAAGGQPEAPISPQERFLVGNFPETVALEKANILTVFVSQQAEGRATPIDLKVPPAGLTLEIFVEADGFKFIGPTHASILVPAIGNSAGASFQLKAVAAPTHVIRISALVAGTCVGGLALDIKVDQSSDASSTPPPVNSSIMRKLAGGDGDVGLILQQDPDTLKFSFTWVDKDGVREPAYLNKSYNDMDKLIGEGIEKVQQIVREIYEKKPAEVRANLKGKGIDWWRQLIPKDVRDRFIKNHKQIKRINIFSPGDPIPWEALFPFETDPPFENGFLIEQVKIARWMNGPLPPEVISLCRADFVSPDEEVLKCTATEVSNVMAMLKKYFDLKGERVAKRDSLFELFDQARVSLLHFACHNAIDKMGSEIFVELGPITPDNFISYEQKLKALTPLIFLNACRTDGKKTGYTALGGWAKCFLGTGAGAFIGTHWEVRDATARKFAEILYRGLVEENKCFGDALDGAREAIKSPSDPTWLAYTFYGDPGAQLKKGAVAAPSPAQENSKPQPS
jgi:hypothetical protein